MLEKEIVKQILDWLTLNHIKAGKVKTMGVVRNGRYCHDPYLYKGFPDIAGFHKGKIFFIEAKRPGEVQSLEQTAFEQDCKDAGIVYILASSLDHVMARIKIGGII